VVSTRRLLPQLARPSDAIVRSVEWHFEPCWRGERLLAWIDGGEVTLTDERGEAAGRDMAEAARLVSRALIDIGSGIIDGVWTDQALMREELPDQRPDTSGGLQRTFVAIDLLELDGARLNDVPYLERRRLLASVLEETRRVRITPSVGMPLAGWLRAWHANGLEFCVAKHVNSRYRPGEVADDWLKVPTQPTGPSILGRILGRRQKPVVHIDDLDPSPPRRRG
jgi:bifunctional non-homologous end joining protein LigD